MTEFGILATRLRRCLWALLLMIVGVVSVSADSTPLDSNTVTKSDVLFFFDSISYKPGEVHFELSRNSMGMSWRIIEGSKDVTGVCNYRQTLTVPVSSSLELKTRGMEILFKPIKPSWRGRAWGRQTFAYRVSKTIGRNPRMYGGDVYASYFAVGDEGWSVETIDND